MIKGWRKVILRDVCEQTYQWNPKEEPRDEFFYIDVSAVSNDTFSITRPQTVTYDTAPGRARKILCSRDVLYATIRPTLKRVALVPPEYDKHIASTAFCVVRANKKKAIPEYLYFLLLSDTVSKSIADAQHGASYPAVTDKDIFKQEVYLPPFPEQKKIAAVLLKLQQAILTQDKIIRTLRDLKKTTMDFVFTRGLRGEKTKSTAIGEMPESWEVKSIGSFCEKPQYGYTASASYEPIGPKLLRITDITEKGVNWDTVPFCQCSESDCAKYLVKENDILIARIGATTGKSYLIKNPPKAIFASYLIRLRPTVGLSARYLFYFLNTNTYWQHILANKGNNMKGGTNSSTLSSLRIPIPSQAEEQQQIGHILSIIDCAKGIRKSKLSALQNLFKTTLNKLMAGDIRIADLDIDIKGLEA